MQVATNGNAPITSAAAPLAVIASSQFVPFQPIYVDPACPTPADIITVRVTPGPSLVDGRMAPEMSREGSTITGLAVDDPKRLQRAAEAHCRHPRAPVCGNVCARLLRA